MAENEEIQRSLGRLEEKLHLLIIEIKQHFEDDKKNFSSIDTRIQKVEKKIHYASGFVAAIIPIFTGNPAAWKGPFEDFLASCCAVVMRPR